ncbi:GntR family transcriptional regulator [Streptomyces sp. JV180]|uniref:GntR family transcriptional regulator n=1 Tax=Streptomyces sp. JV180 TaxID=858634 RepID=UPI00168B2F3C|nr:GntR family transcriptional regulator [Streptomyces sp. JV180]MBD3550004.1 GntR family transcriptional regulator [Streptomyces sp. JV180]
MSQSPGEPQALPPIRRIADDLRRRIAAGEYTPGTRLPSTRQLANAYSVDPKTIYRSVALLKESGQLVSRQGAGVYVPPEPRAAILREPQIRYPWEKERAQLPLAERQESGTGEFDTGRRRDELDFPAQFSRVAAEPDVAERMGIAPGTDLLRRLYRTTVREEEVPLSLITSYIPYDLAAQNPDLLDEGREPWPGGTMHQLKTVGVEIDRIVDESHSRPPTLEEQAALQLASGWPVVELHKVSYSTEDAVVEYSQVILPGDRTTLRYTIQLERWPA